MKQMVDKNWKLIGLPLTCTDIGEAELALESGSFYSCVLPCDIHAPLIAAGVTRDPVVADACYAAEWTEQRSWWFFLNFDTPDAAADADRVTLTLERIDTDATIWLNGSRIGESHSVHIPFSRDIRLLLRRNGQNRLAVRVTTGLESVSDAELSKINWAVSDESPNGYPDRGDTRRAFVRRPQYSTGWDWCPRIATCGLTGHAYLTYERGVAIRNVRVRTLSVGNPARLSVSVCTELLSLFSTADGTLSAELTKDGKTAAFAIQEDILLRAGCNYSELFLEVRNPELWFPNGMGEQPLYTLTVRAERKGGTAVSESVRIGIRTVELDTTRRADGARNFRFFVNGKVCFAKGANWVPCDSLYSRAGQAQKEFYVRSAAEAGMNMLRIWGGGVYEDECFYDACDAAGILIWQDFMHACSALPEEDPSFVSLCREEYAYWAMTLCNHPCLALLCGNNENASNFNPVENPHWNLPFSQTHPFGFGLSNRVAAEVAETVCPWIPYWNSSPFGGDLPNDGRCGDVHQWDACMMNPEMSVRTAIGTYDLLPGAFVSEYGYPGPPAAESICDYFGGAEIDRSSRIWRIHTNTFEKETVDAGIRRYYRDTEDLSLEDYILYAGMVQSLMLSYSLQSFRFRESCGGGLFWMYDDSWGEIGWSVIDYYRRPKIAYYGVRRALRPVLAVLRRTGDTVTVKIVNDTGRDVTGEAEIGYLSADGSIRRLESVTYFAPACSRECTVDYRLSAHGVTEEDLRRGFVVFLPQEAEMPASRLMATSWRQMKLPDPEFTVGYADAGDDLFVTFAAKTYVHGLHSGDLPCIPERIDAEDLYFDLLPGERKTVCIRCAAGMRPQFCAITAMPEKGGQ